MLKSLNYGKQKIVKKGFKGILLTLNLESLETKTCQKTTALCIEIY